MKYSLNTFSVGDKGKITGFDIAGKAYRKRLLAMGLTRGTEFKITRFAPLGDQLKLNYAAFHSHYEKKKPQ